jgi:ATP-dependent exoDNAse (exonuclease V) alpha subunit
VCKLAREHPNALLCTLTGKAASVLQRRTGIAATTLHSVFYRLEAIRKDKDGKEVMQWREALEPGSRDGCLVLIDECMMVGKKIMDTVLRSGADVIACGDPNQLWPVLDEPYFLTPDLELTEIHRQALDSPIIRQAHAVRVSGWYQLDGEAFRVQRAASDQLIGAGPTGKGRCGTREHASCAASRHFRHRRASR